MTDASMVAWCSMYSVYCMTLVHIMALCTVYVTAVQFDDLNNCCHYCASRQEKWVEVKGAWTLTVDDVTKLSFMSPTSVTPDDAVTTGLIHRGRHYHVTYGGAPVSLTKHDTRSSDTLNQHYIQLDLGAAKAVSGVMSQGGHYSEETQTLFEGRHSWMTSFAVSYLEVSSSTFKFIKQENGTVRVFPGNLDAGTSLITSFTHPVMTSHVRIHPLTVREHHGDSMSALVRVGAVVCAQEGCQQQQHHCEVNPWLPWGPCGCRGEEGCYQRRTRTVYRHNACRGRPCPHLSEHKPCTPPEPLESILARYLSIAAAVVVVIAVILGVILKKVLLEKKRNMFRRTREVRERTKQQAAQAAEMKLVEDSKKAANFDEFDETPPDNSNITPQGPLVAVEEVNPRWRNDDVMDEFNMEDLTEDIMGSKTGPPPYRF